MGAERTPGCAGRSSVSHYSHSQYWDGYAQSVVVSCGIAVCLLLGNDTQRMYTERQWRKGRKEEGTGRSSPVVMVLEHKFEAEPRRQSVIGSDRVAPLSGRGSSNWERVLV
jgi:hypothetical protein